MSTDEEKRERHRSYMREWQKKKYKESSEFREKRRECNKKYRKRKIEEGPEFLEKERKKKMEWISFYRKKAIKIYGSKCQNCGNENVIVLQWHHKYGNKDDEKRDHSIKVVRRISKQGKQEDGIDLLCANCHILADLRDGTASRGEKNID